MTSLPPMEIEYREGTSNHGLRPFTEHDTPEFEQQLQHVLDFVEFSKTQSNGYPTELLDLYNPFETELSYRRVLSKFGFRSWRECVAFVEDDECNEFFTRVSIYSKAEGLITKEDKGFINGTGLGVHDYYLHETAVVLQKVFDAKYHYQRKRPLTVLQERIGFVCPNLFNYMHPGHPEFPTGHGGKFFSALRCFYELWECSQDQYNDVAIGAYVLSMARSGGGVHFPDSNVASGYMVGLPEMEHYGIDYSENETINKLILEF